jgi:hypothetical protein
LPKSYDEETDRNRLCFCAVTDQWPLWLREEKRRRSRSREGLRLGDEIKDERATTNEQWIVKVRMLDNGRKIQVRADRAQWEKLRENDRVKVTYRATKYTGTVWDADSQ